MFQDNLLKGIAGQNITEAEGKYKLTESLLTGDALTVFNTKSIERGRRTDNNFSKVLMGLTTYVRKITYSCVFFWSTVHYLQYLEHSGIHEWLLLKVRYNYWPYK